MPTYSDRQIVAAFNHCFDLKRWNELPAHVRDRVGDLLKRHRLGLVCFSQQVGIGLRVYASEPDVRLDSGDTCSEREETPTTPAGWRVGTGHWMECPAELWSKATQPPSPKNFLVMDKKGQAYYVKMERDDSNDDESEDEDEEKIEKYIPLWSAQRRRAERMTKEKAEQTALEFGGVIVQA